MNSNLPLFRIQNLRQTCKQNRRMYTSQHRNFYAGVSDDIVATLIYIGFQVSADLAHVPPLSLYSVILLSTALFIALGFEFVNGFHDTANAVATVIYTNALPAPVAVMWAGFVIFLG